MREEKRQNRLMKEEMQDRPDRRNLESRQRIKEGFLRLKQHRRYNDITVAELCREAGVSRGTFYRHYQNIAEVVDDILSSVLANIRRLSDYFPTVDRKKVEETTKPLCRIVIEETEYKSLLMDPEMTETIVRKVMEFNGEDFMEMMRSHTGMTDTEITTFAFFQINGCLAAARRYCQIGKDDWDVRQKIIDDFIYNAIGDISDK